MIRTVLEIYRNLQFFLFGRSKKGVMAAGNPCSIEPFKCEENHGDIVHPCVRYIPEGFEGHKWWMVYTPYYSADASLENPILCYGDSDDNRPPQKWNIYCLVNEKPKDGYNSDPNLLFSNNQLYVFWRENIVTHRDNYPYLRATFCAKVGGGTIEKIGQPSLIAKEDHEDPECCPTFMPDYKGGFIAYAMHLQFYNPKIRHMNSIWRSIVERSIQVLDLAGIYSQQKSYGIAIWEGGSPFMSYQHKTTVRFTDKNKLWRPWHMDFFDYGGRRYAVVQTNQCNADIALAWSEDQEHFTFFPKPLITNYSIDKLGIYKPTALVKDGAFYLYYTAQDKDNRALNKLYLTKMDFNELITKIK